MIRLSIRCIQNLTCTNRPSRVVVWVRQIELCFNGATTIRINSTSEIRRIYNASLITLHHIFQFNFIVLEVLKFMLAVFLTLWQIRVICILIINDWYLATWWEHFALYAFFFNKVINLKMIWKLCHHSSLQESASPYVVIAHLMVGVWRILKLHFLLQIKHPTFNGAVNYRVEGGHHSLIANLSLVCEWVALDKLYAINIRKLSL